MKKKIIITERQMAAIVGDIRENHQYERVLQRIVTDLDLNYEPTIGSQEIGNQFFNTPMVSKKVNNELITPKELLTYLSHKYDGLNVDFLKQVIKDWFHGLLQGNFKLSKNVPL